MGTEVRIASWNVNGETSVLGSQLQARLSFLADHAPDLDIIFLQAVQSLNGIIDISRRCRFRSCFTPAAKKNAPTSITTRGRGAIAPPSTIKYIPPVMLAPPATSPMNIRSQVGGISLSAMSVRFFQLCDKSWLVPNAVKKSPD